MMVKMNKKGWIRYDNEKRIILHVTFCWGIRYVCYLLIQNIDIHPNKMTEKYTTPNSYSTKKRSMNEMGLLSNITRDSLFKKIRNLEDRDRITYRKPHSSYYSLKKRYPRSIISKPSWDSLRDSSSEESIEYEVINSYEVGSLGLVPFEEDIESEKCQTIKTPQPLKLESKSKQLNFDLVTARILSDMGLLNKFERTYENTIFLRRHPLRKRRQYYPYWGRNGGGIY